MGLPGLEPGTSSLSVTRSPSFVRFIGFNGFIESAYLCRIRVLRDHRAVIGVRYGQPGCSTVAVNRALAQPSAKPQTATERAQGVLHNRHRPYMFCAPCPRRDAMEGLLSLARLEVMHDGVRGANWQRCQVHYARNLLGTVGAERRKELNGFRRCRKHFGLVLAVVGARAASERERRLVWKR